MGIGLDFLGRMTGQCRDQQQTTWYRKIRHPETDHTPSFSVNYGMHPDIELYQNPHFIKRNLV
jgi:hypothetical protein